jgi:hypothetical protein
LHYECKNNACVGARPARRPPPGAVGGNPPAVVDALLGLIESGDLWPTAPRASRRAGVSLRSVFQHFTDLALFALLPPQTEKIWSRATAWLSGRRRGADRLRRPAPTHPEATARCAAPRADGAVLGRDQTRLAQARRLDASSWSLRPEPVRAVRREPRCWRRWRRPAVSPHGKRCGLTNGCRSRVRNA